MARMLYDAMCAVDVLAKRPEVNADRIGAIGHSLGGKEALYLAAFDDRIKAAVSCEGGVGLDFSNWDADWYLGQQIKAPNFHHDNDEIIALVAPRALMVIGGESADGEKSRPYLDAARPVWRIMGAEDEALKLVVHKDGHNFPEPGALRDQVYEWLDRQLSKP
jgi:pimeloyl-ACP methyl ester carboxylesterase